MFTHLTGQARRVLQLAHQQALERNHDYVGTEHLLLAMLRDNTGGAVRVLEDCRVPITSLLQDLDAELEPSDRALDIERLPLTLSVQRALQRAREEAEAMHQRETGLEHVLLGILREEDAQATQLLDHHGLTLELCRADVARRTLEENRDHLVQTTLPAIAGAGRDPSALDLEDRITPEVLPREWRPRPTPLLAPTMQALEAQLRGTQLVLGGFMGGFAMVEMYGYGAMFGGAIIGILVAGFQSSFLGSLFGGVSGFFIGFQYRDIGVWIVICSTIIGLFLGSWLGNVWRFSVPTPPVKDEEGEG